MPSDPPVNKDLRRREADLSRIGNVPLPSTPEQLAALRELFELRRAAAEDDQR